MQIRKLWLITGLLFLLSCGSFGLSQQTAEAPLPDIRQLMREVQEHQKQLDKIRENYTYTSYQTTQDIDASGQIKKTETAKYEVFFANAHITERKEKSNEILPLSIRRTHRLWFR